MNHLPEILHEAESEELHKSRDASCLVPIGNRRKQHTNVHSLAQTLKRRSGIVWMKKRCRRLRFLLTVILLSGTSRSCDRQEAKELHPVSMNFSTDGDSNALGLDFQIERTDLEHSSSVTVVCGCYWFQSDKECFTLPGYICNSTGEFLQVQIPHFSRQHVGKYQFRVLKGVHTTRTCILRIQELKATTPETILNDARWSTTLTPDPPGRNGESRVTETIIICLCIGIILPIAVVIIVVYKRKTLFHFMEKRNYFVNANDTTTSKPGTEDGPTQRNNTEKVPMLHECISPTTVDINANLRDKSVLCSTESESV